MSLSYAGSEASSRTCAFFRAYVGTCVAASTCSVSNRRSPTHPTTNVAGIAFTQLLM